MTTPIRIRYQTVEFDTLDIHVCTLRDNQQFEDPDDIALKLGISSATWPIFGIIWPSSLVLAHHMSNYATKGKKILEIGCGMALSSLLLNKQNADITATDYHPEAAAFLQRNTELNHDQAIDFHQIDWADKNDDLGLFDLIIGSDILYEDSHIQLVADFIAKHTQPAAEVILVDPGRGRKTKLKVKMELLGFQSKLFKPENTDYLEKPFKGHILKFWRDE